jgi:hypothetical protein
MIASKEMYLDKIDDWFLWSKSTEVASYYQYKILASKMIVGTQSPNISSLMAKT